MTRIIGSSDTIIPTNPRVEIEIPPMPACWDNQEDWEGWCRLMAITYRQEYRPNWTLREALDDYCIDCIPSIFMNLMIKSGRCKKYEYAESKERVNKMIVVLP